MTFSASTYQYEGGKIIPLEDSPSYLNEPEVALWILNTLLKCPKANHVKIFNEDGEVISTLDQENVFEWYESTQDYHHTARNK